MIVDFISALENQISKLILNSEFYIFCKRFSSCNCGREIHNISRLVKASSAISKYSQRLIQKTF